MVAVGRCDPQRTATAMPKHRGGVRVGGTPALLGGHDGVGGEVGAAAHDDRDAVGLGRIHDHTQLQLGACHPHHLHSLQFV